MISFAHLCKHAWTSAFCKELHPCVRLTYGWPAWQWCSKLGTGFQIITTSDDTRPCYNMWSGYDATLVLNCFGGVQLLFPFTLKLKVEDHTGNLVILLSVIISIHYQLPANRGIDLSLTWGGGAEMICDPMLANEALCGKIHFELQQGVFKGGCAPSEGFVTGIVQFGEYFRHKFRAGNE